MNEGIIKVRVTPRSARNAVLGWQDDVLLVRLTSPPVEGEANRALCRLLAQELDLPPSRVYLAKGERGRSKQIAIPLEKLAEVRERWPILKAEP